MSSRKHRKYNSRLERMAHIVVDGVVRITDAINSKEFSRTGKKNTVGSMRKGRLVGKVGRPAAVVGENEQRVLDIIHIEAKSGTCLTLKKTRELIENVINDNDDEDAPFHEVSMSATYGFVKRHPELKTGTPKNLDINRLDVSCRSVLKPCAKLPDELKSLLSPTLEIWANGSGWMDNECFERYALTILLPSIIERRKRMSLENGHILLLLDSRASRADPSIW
ncbi:uncharacterized protein MONOS_15744 [Monocercomonoides exilis]|uniref:uncharacterized protein n=1 Tax=Monocercomonoides exilis TaxID=2049356 RepID=UPI00355AA3F1|nr:hypothetical protein MONOS_15744 [Monocercomonoides exilis]|eukprot:MONOS_15744.1-p1 / transcript=MONOS_15744.1 / gene=MONOS_15744 / organism=Monocercomonoides_exilis_PA203 / gene_product=unspecified product / transcript_product=unspecified product / location=Mono_scaffold01338:9826-10764(+) / protein_length=223 / sequence_SO=supercontig / SO=protein_coding / is_pseudo=false